MNLIWSALAGRWQKETDGAGLAVVRIAVALAVLFEILEICLTGQVIELLVEPQISFKYAFFAWLGRPQGLMPHVLAWTLVVLAATVAIGWRTRWTSILLASGYCYWFLIDAANYSDHGYLVCLLLILIAWLPTNRWASADVYMDRELRTTVPGWTVELLRTQLILVYFFFGLALLNGDWLNGAPLLAWVETEAEENWLARLLSGQTGLIRSMAICLPILYLSVGPLLCWRRSRLIALVLITAFQIFDWFTFQLSVSPLLLTLVNLVFFEPSHVRAIGNWLVLGLTRVPLTGLIWKTLCRLGWLVDACVSWFDDTPLLGPATASGVNSTAANPPSAKTASKEKAAARSPQAVNVLAKTSAPQWAIALWLLIQVWMPLRYMTLETNPDWTDLATTFAWRGQHRDKQCDLKLSVIQPSQELAWPLDPSEEFPVPMAIFFTEERLEELGLSEGLLKDLVAGAPATLGERIASLKLPEKEADRILRSYEQTVGLRLAGHQYEQVVQRPELIRQYARQIAQVMSNLLGEQVQIQAELLVKLNHRPAEPLFKSSDDLDLARIPNVYELASRLTNNKSPLPAVEERIAFAKEWAELRRIELEQTFDIVSPNRPQQTGEPAKLPPFTDEDERWFQEKYGMK